MVTFYVLSKRLCLERKWLSDVGILLLTKMEYGFEIHILKRLIKCLKLISEKWLTVICLMYLEFS